MFWFFGYKEMIFVDVFFLFVPIVIPRLLPSAETLGYKKKKENLGKSLSFHSLGPKVSSQSNFFCPPLTMLYICLIYTSKGFHCV